MPEAHALDIDSMHKFFIFLVSEHGGVRDENWAPRNLPGNMISRQKIGGGCNWDMRRASLVEIANRNSDGISPVFGSFLNPYLEHVNLLEGFDIPRYLGHHRGMLGNYHETQEIL